MFLPKRTKFKSWVQIFIHEHSPICLGCFCKLKKKLVKFPFFLFWQKQHKQIEFTKNEIIYLRFRIFPTKCHLNFTFELQVFQLVLIYWKKKLGVCFIELLCRNDNIEIIKRSINLLSLGFLCIDCSTKVEN